MKGICGYCGKERPFQEAKSADSSYFHLDGSIFHLMIPAVPTESSPKQSPVFYQKERSRLLAFYGELYNRSALLKELSQQKLSLSPSASVSELLLLLYEREGFSFLERLNGSYLILLWEEKEKTLFLIRDKLGCETLYYRCLQDECFFANELSDLWTLLEEKPAYQTSALYQYFSNQVISHPETIYQDVFCLPPATIFTFQNGSFSMQRYWNLSFGKNQTDSFSDALEKSVSLLKDSIHLRLPTEEFPATFLSGGLDSSVLIMLLQKDFKKEPFESYFLDFHQKLDNPIQDKKTEARLSEIFQTEIHSRHHILPLDGKDFLAELPQVVSCFDQPFSASYSGYFLCKEVAKKHHFAIGGDGADEIYGSYGLEICCANNPTLTKEEELALFYRHLNVGDEEKQFFLQEEPFSSFWNAKSSWEKLCNDWEKLTGNTPLQRSLEYHHLHALPDQVLCYSTRLSHVHGLTIRSPYLDHRLVAYLASLPDNYKIKGTNTKLLLRQYGKQLGLPDPILGRKKEGFLQPIHSWMRLELKECILDTLSLSHLLDQDFLDGPKVYYLLKSYYQDPVKQDYLCELLWNLFLFQFWMDQQHEKEERL